MSGGPRILIVGGRYGGMHTALRLERLLRPGEATVMVADPRSYVTYQPLLAEAAAGNLEPRHVVVPLRGVLHRTQVIKAAVSSVDHARRVAYLSLGLYRGVAEVYGVRMRGFPAWMIHRTYHLLKLPTMNRRLRVVSDWTLALPFRREAVSLDVLEHPHEDFQAALRAIARGPSHATPFPGQEEGS